jgi:hypothetical protein
MNPSSSLNQQKEIAAMQERIARAATERDTWRASGMEEKYLEACSMVEALEFQLDGLRQDSFARFERS